MEFLKDLWQFMKERKKFWLAPLIVVLLLLGLLIVLGGSSAGAVTALHLAFLDETERPIETYDWSSNSCANYGADLGWELDVDFPSWANTEIYVKTISNG